MDFFAQQDRARRQTGLLIVLMCLAVVGLILVTSLAVGIALVLGGAFEAAPGAPGAPRDSAAAMAAVWDWQLLTGVGVVVIAVVALGSLFKHLQMRGGGKAVAEALGGRLIDPASMQADERRILNIVEEMALAAGTPVPPVYVLEDESINAFAAGHTPQDAVIGITRGCIRLLGRSELQGVVAHEFSHILHGDMRLNMRLVAALHGILLIGLIGHVVLRSMTRRSVVAGGMATRRGNDRNNTMVIVLALGAVLIVIGFAGTFFGNLIKAAVSRQREFLADASAVQFTRNPDGIAGALKKIGGHAAGSRVAATNAPEFSHLFFSGIMKSGLASLMSTHPPLGERIRRVEPGWDGEFVHPSAPVGSEAAEARPMGAASHSGHPAGVLGGIVMGSRVLETAARQTGNTSRASQAGGAQPERTQADPRTAGAAALRGSRALRRIATLPADRARASIATIGQPGAEHVEYALGTLAAIGQDLIDAAHEPFAARALIYGLLLDQNPGERADRLAELERLADPQVWQALQRLLPRIDALDARLRLPLVEVALPALRQLSPTQHARFRVCLGVLVPADQRADLMAWALQRLVVHHLDEPFGRAETPLGTRRAEAALLLAALARAGKPGTADAAFASAAGALPFGELAMPPAEAATARELDAAVIRLGRVRPQDKPVLLEALVRAIEHDGELTVAEAELLRAIADSLDCPLPPVLES